MRRISLSKIMIVIAILAVCLGTGIGLGRRARRFEALALEYGREANALENRWMKSGPSSPGEPDVLMEEIHWNDSVANEYRFAASQPWLPFEPDPETITCGCGYHARRRAGTTK